jgi:hypothetical protein
MFFDVSVFFYTMHRKLKRRFRGASSARKQSSEGRSVQAYVTD